MKNIYKITKGQLISLWVFGVIGWFYSIDSYSDFASFLSVFIPAILFFYTIGWRNFNKKETLDDSKESFKIKNLIPYFKKFIKPLLVILLIGGVILGFNIFSENKKEKVRIEKLTQDYNQAITKIDSLREEYKTCLQPTFDKNYKEEQRSCNLLLNKIKSDYRSCLGYADRDWCIYTYDYEKVDCSEKTLKNKASLSTLSGNKPPACYDVSNRLSEVFSIIEEYEKLEK